MEHSGKINKKNFVRIGILLTVFLLSLPLIGCNGDSGPTGEGIYGGVDISKLESANINITSHFDPGINRDTTSIGRAAKWWSENTNGEAEMNVIAADIYPTRLMAMIGSGSPADIIMVDQRGWMPRLAVLNVLEPVDEYVDVSTMMDYEQRLFEFFKWKDDHYAAYINGAWGYALWYNKTMFINNGLQTPREYWEEGNWTWDTFLEVAQELTQDTTRDGEIDQWGYSFWGVEVFPASNLAKMTDVKDDGTVDVIWDSPEFTASAQFAADLMNKYNVWSPDLGFHVQNFRAGKVAMSAGANDFVRQFAMDMRDEVDNAPFPIGPHQDPDDVKYIGFSLFMGLGRGSRNIDASRAFLAVMREKEEALLEEDIIDPESNYAVLTQEQIDMCEYVDSKVILNYESGFGNWENNRWSFWGDILFNNVPVSTALEMYRPILEKDIRDTLEAVFVDVKPFEPVPVETFESGIIENFIITTEGLPELSSEITSELATGEDALEGTTSLRIVYPESDSWRIMARTDHTKLELPSFHRYNIEFDYLVNAQGPGSFYLTIRPYDTLDSEEVSYGFVRVQYQPGEQAVFEGHIDVLEASEDNVLIFIGEGREMEVIIDNFHITEG